MSKTKKTKVPTLHDLAVRLCEGGQVEFIGLSIKAKDALDPADPCLECQMDSICCMEMTDLCAECDGYHHHAHILVLANEK